MTKAQAKRLACERIAGYIENMQADLYGWPTVGPGDTPRPPEDVARIDEALDELWREMVRRGAPEPVAAPSDTEGR
jgi:hypothetical protein